MTKQLIQCSTIEFFSAGTSWQTMLLRQHSSVFFFLWLALISRLLVTLLMNFVPGIVAVLDGYVKVKWDSGRMDSCLFTGMQHCLCASCACFHGMQKSFNLAEPHEEVKSCNGRTLLVEQAVFLLEQISTRSLISCWTKILRMRNIAMCTHRWLDGLTLYAEAMIRGISWKVERGRPSDHIKTTECNHIPLKILSCA